MTVLERNWRCGRTGEIDIVARDGDALVVCEVKTRRAGGSSSTRWRPSRPPRPSDCGASPSAGSRNTEGAPPGGVRIDLVGVLLPDRGAPVVEHVRGVA